jgi:hypothetical protein
MLGDKSVAENNRGIINGLSDLVTSQLFVSAMRQKDIA